MKTTLKAVRSHSPCESGWTKLLDYLRKTKADDEPLSLLEILKSNGLDDALWCLRAVDGHDEEIRLYAVWCARQVQHLITDPRSLDALDVADAFANGKATKAELAAARAAAEAAAWDAAWDAARAAARAAAGAAAWAAAGYAAEDAARAAAEAAARDAAWDAARAAARAAAGAAAWAAARYAAEDAARAAAEAAAGDAAMAAARYAAEAAARAAAWAAAGDAQEKELIRICELSKKELTWRAEKSVESNG